MPSFSIITPTWNQGTYIETCIRSVLEQGVTHFEHLIFDNKSTDDTASIVRRYPHVTFVSEPDRGQAHAINKGFQAATGDILCWLNADDAYPPYTLAKLCPFFADPSVQVLYGDVEQIGYEKKETQISKGRFTSRLDLIRWWSSDVKLHQPAIFFRRQIIDRIGLLREDLHYAMDYEYWWRMSEATPFYYVPHVVAIQHRQPASKTIIAWDRVLGEREQIFAPFYSMLSNKSAAELHQEKKTCLAQHYLTRAFIAAEYHPNQALSLLKKAIVQKPSLLITSSPLGVLKNLFQSLVAFSRGKVN